MVDITSFFSPSGTRSSRSNASKAISAKKPSRRRARVINIDEDEDEDEKNENEAAEVVQPPKKRVKRNVSETKEKLTPIESLDYFKINSTRLRTRAQPKLKKKVIDTISDDDFDDFDDFDDNEDDFNNDDEDFVQVTSRTRKPAQRKTESKKESLKAELAELNYLKPISKPIAETKPRSSSKKASTTSQAKSKKTVKKDEQSLTNSVLNLLKKIPDAELPDVSDYDPKTFNFFAANAGKQNQESDLSFEPPIGKPDCLAGLTIVFTGVFPHLNRSDAENLAKRYGAKVTKSISKKTSLVVLGSDAGPSKVKKIMDLNIKTTTEDGFCQLVNGLPEAGGSDNELAKKAIEKRKLEEEKIIEAAKKEEEEAIQREKELKKKRAKINAENNTNNNTNNQINDNYVKPSMKPDDEKLWTDKYAPTNLQQICGNKGGVNKLNQWLQNWDQNKRKGFKFYGDLFPAVLISGPPGIGKTTAAHLVAKTLNYDILERNASDVRSKKLLNDGIKNILNNNSLMGYFDLRGNRVSEMEKKKFCLIMDEVDGMSSGDRGGVGALSSFCRKTSIPIILICNDKSSPKMRPFDKVCLDIPFRRPSAIEMKSRLMTIAYREKLKLDPNSIEQLVECTRNDIRQIINLLSTISRTEKTIDNSNRAKISDAWKKNVALKSFDIVGKYLSGSIWSPNSDVDLNKKIEYYFDDHDFTPLMVQENYLNTRPQNTQLSHLELVSKAADSMSEADIIDSKIHSSEQLWSLMPLHGIMSSIRPSSIINGQIAGRIKFTSWLGNNSKTNKYLRLLQEINYHCKLRTLTKKFDLRLDYFQLMSGKMCKPLLEDGSGGIEEVIELLDNYYLSKEDWENILEFSMGNNPYKAETVAKQLPTQVKSGFTRKYNLAKHPVAINRPGLTTAGKGDISSVQPDLEDVVEDDTVEDKADDDDDNKKDEDITKDKLIKAKKPKAVKTKASAAKPRATKTTKGSSTTRRAPRKKK
ncbi:replication factor C subunit 1 [Ascoidea rubescens DSM 1968]|uniref:Replication factor C subunit 1 n=1 Tax=Ascoidea rubescens DSM 1968 TaxID=1344418 RepID=A0A1D2V9R6_9ASCO|nr:DNA replication factor C, large subunit [Ascoidea rubescens DSM 1968]ODV58402.1 DNA replication factor C, large subunit [Ascoidea rubescens DSM 1968]